MKMENDLLSFVATTNLSQEKVFLHTHIDKTTWVSPDHITENQIDHVCINNTFRRTLQDVGVKRGADAASDHHGLSHAFQ